MTKETCQTKWPNVEDGMICAGGEEGKDTCQVFIKIFLDAIDLSIYLMIAFSMKQPVIDLD